MRNLIVHPTSINTSIYVVAALKSAGLRDDDLKKEFTSMVRRKWRNQSSSEWLIIAEELFARLQSSAPIACLYNSIDWTMNPQSPKDDRSYVPTTSSSLVQKIWSIASDWESLLARQRSMKSTALNLTVHRLTGSKEVTKLV